MKIALPFALFALLALPWLACSTTHPPPDFDGSAGHGGASGGTAGVTGVVYDTCPQHRVEGIECAAPTSAGGVLRKDGFRCASCSGVDALGTPTEKPVGCKTVAGGDLCVSDCGECS